jgi:type I restriction enzyme S subunit
MLEGWAKASIGEIGTVVTGTTPATSSKRFYEGVIPFVAPGDLGNGLWVTTAEKTLTEEGFRAAKRLPKGAVLFTCIGATIGKAGVAARDLATNQQINAVICDPKRADNLFVYYLLALRAESIKRLAGAQAVPIVNKSTFEDVTAPLPPLPEQRKVAKILRTWDEALEKLTALRAAKARRISSLRQRLFEAEYASHNRLQRARDLFETVSERARPDLPLLAVMQDIGIVRRDELDRRVAMPDGDTSTYKVVRPGDFVISLRSFEGGLEYSSIIGLVSPAYTVLRTTTDLVGDYYRHFFKSRSFIGRLDKLIFGIRDGKQIAFRDFGDMYIPAPPVAEQEAQARTLGSLEADLALEDERIAALTRQKRGLMQKLLTGEWRLEANKLHEVSL